MSGRWLLFEDAAVGEPSDFDAWSHRAPITSQAAQIPTAYPYALIIDLNAHFSDQAAFWQNVASNGQDIRVAKADGVTQLARAVRAFDVAGESGLLYVHHPDISASSDVTIYVYWGNAAAPAYAAGDEFGAEQIWGPAGSRESIWGHWTLDPVGAFVDTSGNSRHLSVVGTPDPIAGKLGNAYNFDGAAEYLTFNAGAPSVPLTVMTWAWADDYGNFNDLVEIGHSSTSNNWFALVTQQTTGVLKFEARAGATVGDAVGAVAVGTGAWFHAAGVAVSSTSRRVLLNAANEVISTVSASPSVNRAWLAASARAGGPNSVVLLDGRLDEARIYSRALSNDEITTIYNNQSDNAPFWVRGTIEILRPATTVEIGAVHWLIDVVLSPPPPSPGGPVIDFSGATVTDFSGAEVTDP